MADIKQLFPFLLQWEGGYVEDPDDLGGATNMGVTLKAWLTAGCDLNGDGAIDKEDLRRITWQDVVERVLKPYYWDRWQADLIHCQSLANILVDWVWSSGETGITIPQYILGVETSGVVQQETLDAVNNYPDPEELFNRIKSARIDYIERICRERPANNRFKRGWLNRINDLRFK